MTAGAHHNEKDETDKSGSSQEGHLRQEETAERKDKKNSGSKAKPSCDMNAWEDKKRNNSDLTSGETFPMLPSNSVSEIPMRGGIVRSHFPYHTNAVCGLPSTHTVPSSRVSCDDHSLLSSSSSLRQSCYPYCSARNVNSRWMSFRGSSVPPGIEDFQSGASSTTPKVSGCSVLLDKSIDLIELTADDDLGSPSEPCDCSDKQLKKWRFSQNKCKSLDCANKYLPSVSCLSNVAENLPKSRICYSSDGFECNQAARSSIDCDNSLIPDYMTSNLANEASGGFNRTNFDEEFRLRSLSLTPTVNLAIFETESYSSDDDNNGLNRSDSINCDFDNVFSSSNSCLNNLDNSQLGAQAVSAPLLNRTIPCSPSAAQLSLASSMTDGGAPICKICHMTSKDGDPLISPCRCSGTMQYIHCGCLMHWLEISSKKSRKPPSCELCQYQYHWHKKFKVRHWQFPHCSRRDKVLHVLFFISVMIMIGCATITIMCFKQDKGTKVDPDRTELTDSEIVTLVCGVLFFLAFFVAMYVEVKARNTIYKLLVRFVYLNQQWYIDEYEKKDSAPVSV